MNDRELLEFAAKAMRMPPIEWGNPKRDAWNPLTDAGDRYRLLSNLKGRVDFESQMVFIKGVIIHWPDGEPDEARAIVRAAAEVGKRMAIEEENHALVAKLRQSKSENL